MSSRNWTLRLHQWILPGSFYVFFECSPTLPRAVSLVPWQKNSRYEPLQLCSSIWSVALLTRDLSLHWQTLNNEQISEAIFGCDILKDLRCEVWSTRKIFTAIEFSKTWFNSTEYTSSLTYSISRTNRLRTELANTQRMWIWNCLVYTHIAQFHRISQTYHREVMLHQNAAAIALARVHFAQLDAIRKIITRGWQQWGED